MNILNTIMLQASGGGGGFGGMIMILAMVAIFYFFMIRPQSKKQKEIKKAREAMRKGDKVVTAGGIHGQIRAISDDYDYIVLEICKGVDIRVDKASVYPASPESAKSAKPRKEEKPKEIEQAEEVAEEDTDKK